MHDYFISIVLLNWNGRKDIIGLLSSLEKINYQKKYIEIIVVDNGSTDNSQVEIKSKFKNMSEKWMRLLLIENNTNVGVTAGHNIGFRKTSSNIDYIWILDNDVIVDPESLNNLLKKFIKDENLGISGSIIFPLISYNDMQKNLNEKGEIGCKVSYFSTNIYKKDINYSETSKFKDFTYKNMDYCIGCSNMFKKEILEKVGYLDEDFFLYYDDTYFAYCVSQAGFNIVTALDSIVYHKGHASTGGVHKPLGIYYTTLSELIFFRKTMGKLKFSIYFILIFFKRFLLAIFRLIKQKDIPLLFEGINMFIKANLDFLR